MKTDFKKVLTIIALVVVVGLLVVYFVLPALRFVLRFVILVALVLLAVSLYSNLRKR